MTSKDASLEKSGESLVMQANSEERVKAVLDVLQSKLVKRGISLKSLKASDPVLSGKIYRITAQLADGISGENAKKITALLRNEGPKSVKANIQGDEVRVTSKSRDDLQAVIALIKGADLDFDTQFVNYR
jgi:cyclic-di-GMP-binding protein